MDTRTEPAAVTPTRREVEFAQIRIAIMTAAMTVALLYSIQLYRNKKSPIPSVQLAEEARPKGKSFRGDYQFSEDWFSYNIPVWEMALAPYKGKPNLQYLEVGVFEGMSSVWMLENVLTDPGCRITGIDIFADPELGGKSSANTKETCLANFERARGKDKVRLIAGSSQVELRKLPVDSFDIVYIDGSHSAQDVLEDAILSWRLVKEGGLLIFDDYRWHDERPPEQKPMMAIDIFYKIYGKHFEVLHNSYQVIFRKRNAKQPPR